MKLTDTWLLSGAEFAGGSRLYRFSPRSFANPRFKVAGTAPATFRLDQGIEITPVPGGRLVTPTFATGRTVRDGKTVPGLPGYWVVA